MVHEVLGNRFNSSPVLNNKVYSNGKGQEFIVVGVNFSSEGGFYNILIKDEKGNFTIKSTTNWADLRASKNPIGELGSNIAMRFGSVCG